MDKDEVSRLKRRIAKCDRRLAAGYKAKGKESEGERRIRLLKRLSSSFPEA